MTITILCAGALALPGAPDRPDRPALLARHGPPAQGPLARLLAHTRAPRATHDDALVPRELPDEAWLRERFGADGHGAMAAQALHALPRALPDDQTHGSERLLVRPVHLHAGLDHVLMAVPQPDEIGAAEAEALAAAASRLFHDDGLLWWADTPHAWTLRATSAAGRDRLATLAALNCRSARLAAGRNIDAWQPQGPAASAWRAISSELQMLWFEHPANQAREAGGRPALNSVWLEGRPAAVQKRPFEGVITSDEATAGLALAAGAEVSALPATAGPEDFARMVAIQEQAGPLLLDLHGWRRAEANADPAAWHDAWTGLDTLLARLAAAGHTVSTIVLAGERDRLEFEIQPADRWAFWRRRRLGALLADRQ